MIGIVYFTKFVTVLVFELIRPWHKLATNWTCRQYIGLEFESQSSLDFFFKERKIVISKWHFFPSLPTLLDRSARELFHMISLPNCWPEVITRWFIYFILQVCKLGEDKFFLTLVSYKKLKNMMRIIFSEDEFLSPYGIRSLSKVSRSKLFVFKISTVELGYNELGYNETSAITRTFKSPVFFFYIFK